MSDKLMLRVVTPERIVLEQEVDQVVGRSIDGELCILPGHEPLLTALGIDIIRYEFDKEDHTASVIGGVLEVNNNEVTILSDLAELDVEIDEARAHQAKDRAEAEMMHKVDKLDLFASEIAISRSIARLKAAEVAKRRRSHHK